MDESWLGDPIKHWAVPAVGRSQSVRAEPAENLSRPLISVAFLLRSSVGP